MEGTQDDKWSLAVYIFNILFTLVSIGMVTYIFTVVIPKIAD